MMARAKTPASQLARLSAVLDGARSMLIIVQNTPDPDAIAAAAALRELANERHEIACSVGHSGAVWRAENLALLRYLNLKTRTLADLDLERFDRLAMVDAQPGAGNVSFDSAIRLDVVIDHHPIRQETRSARFTDIRSRYGATSTILFEYLRAAKIEIPIPVATAMVYGIRSDTQDLGRESTKADLEAFLNLYPRASPRPNRPGAAAEKLFLEASHRARSGDDLRQPDCLLPRASRLTRDGRGGCGFTVTRRRDRLGDVFGGDRRLAPSQPADR